MLRGLPDAIDNALYVDNKWPLVVDPTGQAARYLQYQNGAFIVASIPEAVKPEALRARLVSCLDNGRSLVFSFGSRDVDFEGIFADGLFPKVALGPCFQCTMSCMYVFCGLSCGIHLGTTVS